jgi:hypothetical protein
MLSVRTRIADPEAKALHERTTFMNERHSMIGRHSSILVAVSLVASMPAFPEEMKSSAVTPRELAHCMMKRVRANTSESYRAAYKACREQFDAARYDRPADTAMNAAALPESPKQ